MAFALDSILAKSSKVPRSQHLSPRLSLFRIEEQDHQLSAFQIRSTIKPEGFVVDGVQDKDKPEGFVIDGVQEDDVSGQVAVKEESNKVDEVA
jgi:hypothetical protein